MLYKLLDNKPVEIDDIKTYSDFMSNPKNYILSQDNLKDDGIFVSTTFVGVALDYTETGYPLLFETSVFESPTMREIFFKKYTSYDDALAGHSNILYKIVNKTGKIVTEDIDVGK